MAIYTGTTGTIWNDWIDSTASTTTSDIYTYWVSSTSATTTGTIYGTWINEYNTVQVSRAEQLRMEMENQLALQIHRQQQHNRYEEEKRKKLQARRKAKILLLENLNHVQKKEFTKDGFFFVVSPSGRLYRIREGRSINIDLMKGNSRIDVEKRLCAHPGIDCPNEDTMLAQKIYLEHMEQEFLAMANQYDPVRH